MRTYVIPNYCSFPINFVYSTNELDNYKQLETLKLHKTFNINTIVLKKFKKCQLPANHGHQTDSFN